MPNADSRQPPAWPMVKFGDVVEREVQKALRKTLLKYQLHRDQDLFGRAAEFLQRRIHNTRLGRNRRGQKLFRTFAEFDDKAKPNEDMPAD